MPSHRGAHPQDDEQFSASALPRLRAAVHDLSWFRSRGYGDSSALKLVGDRYRLKRRQRNAVARSSCTDREREDRLKAFISLQDLAGAHLEVDAFNVLISVEGAIGGAYLFVGRDSAYRDVSPVRGTYRLVEETKPAIAALRQVLLAVGVESVTWHLDAQVSNVGRMKVTLEEFAPSSDLSWTVVVEEEVDSVLTATSGPVATSDSEILDQASAWTSLQAQVISRHYPKANLCDLRPDEERSSHSL